MPCRIENSGVMMAWNGIMKVARMMKKSTPLPRKRSLAKPYPASVASTMVSRVVPAATTRLLVTCCQIPNCPVFSSPL